VVQGVTCLIAYILEYIETTLGRPVSQESRAVELCHGRLAGLIKYHKKEVEERRICLDDVGFAEELRHGRLGAGHRQGYDLVADIVLASLLEAREDGVVELFERRFLGQLQKWARLYASGDNDIVADFLADLLMPRENSGSRISTYRGYAPLDAWLKRVFLSQADRRRRQVGVVLELDDANRLCHVDLGDEYARRECTQRLKHAFSEMFGVLDDVHRMVLQMAVVDGVEQKKIAAFLGVKDYKITRMKQDATTKVAKAFFDIAAVKGDMSKESIRECLSLIMDGLGEGGVFNTFGSGIQMSE
jgi:DNA-directed RNA polymerase specialized sigma24 family protein